MPIHEFASSHTLTPSWISSFQAHRQALKRTLSICTRRRRFCSLDQTRGQRTCEHLCHNRCRLSFARQADTNLLIQDGLGCAACTRTWTARLEVIHHWQESGSAGWRAPRLGMYTCVGVRTEMLSIVRQFGMTSLSVRQYIIGIYRELGLDEKNITKVQTGGPDGDLGSNEILLSSDKTIT